MFIVLIIIINFVRVSSNGFVKYHYENVSISKTLSDNNAVTCDQAGGGSFSFLLQSRLGQCDRLIQESTLVIPPIQHHRVQAPLQLHTDYVFPLLPVLFSHNCTTVRFLCQRRPTRTAGGSATVPRLNVFLGSLLAWLAANMTELREQSGPLAPDPVPVPRTSIETVAGSTKQTCFRQLLAPTTADLAPVSKESEQFNQMLAMFQSEIRFKISHSQQQFRSHWKSKVLNYRKMVYTNLLRENHTEEILAREDDKAFASLWGPLDDGSGVGGAAISGISVNDSSMCSLADCQNWVSAFFHSKPSVKLLRRPNIVVATAVDSADYFSHPAPALALDLKRRYAARHRYQFVNVNQTLDASRAMPWSKIKLVERFLTAHRRDLRKPRVDYVVWLDADAVVANPQLSLEQIIARLPESDFIASRDPPMWTCLNVCTGIFIIRNSEQSRLMLKRWYDLGASLDNGLYLNNHPFEQHVFNAAVLPKASDAGSSTAFALLPFCLLNSVCFENEYVSGPDSFVLHCFGGRWVHAASDPANNNVTVPGHWLLQNDDRLSFYSRVRDLYDQFDRRAREGLDLGISNAHQAVVVPQSPTPPPPVDCRVCAGDASSAGSLPWCACCQSCSHVAELRETCHDEGFCTLHCLIGHFCAASVHRGTRQKKRSLTAADVANGPPSYRPPPHQQQHRKQKQNSLCKSLCTPVFGPVGSSRWCDCCGRNCGGWRSDCIANNGFCTRVCQSDPFCTEVHSLSLSSDQSVVSVPPPAPRRTSTGSAATSLERERLESFGPVITLARHEAVDLDVRRFTDLLRDRGAFIQELGGDSDLLADAQSLVKLLSATELFIGTSAGVFGWALYLNPMAVIVELGARNETTTPSTSAAPSSFAQFMSQKTGNPYVGIATTTGARSTIDQGAEEILANKIIVLWENTVL